MFCLTLSTLGKIFSRIHTDIFFLFFQVWHFIQIVSMGDTFHEMSNSVFLENKEKNNSNLSSAKSAQRMEKFKKVKTLGRFSAMIQGRQL